MKYVLAVAFLLTAAACAGNNSDQDAGMANASESGMMSDSSNMSGGMGAMGADSSSMMSDSGMARDSTMDNMEH